MSYTTKVLWIDKDTFSETEKASWTQDLLLKHIERPWQNNPQYLLILKDNEFIIVDKQGNLILRKTVGYTIENGVINNNGVVAIKEGQNLHVYDINGDEIYTTTFSATVMPKMYIGLRYLWLAIESSPETFYIYDLSDFSYTSFQKDVFAEQGYALVLNEDGDVAIFAYIDGSLNTHFARATPSDIEADVTVAYEYKTWKAWGRPDGIAGLFNLTREAGGTSYNTYYLVNRDLDYVKILEKTWGEYSIGFYAIADVNLERALIFNEKETAVSKYTFDLNTMTYELVDTFNLTETPEDVGIYFNNGDMTPDGKYAIITVPGSILIIDWETKEIVKTIPKAFVGAPIKALVT